MASSSRKILTRPKEIAGHKVEGSWRSHQVPFSDVRSNPASLQVLENWMRSYKAETLFDASGRLLPELFAFNGDPNNPHLPHHYVHNSVAYTGTHDNDTTRGWYDKLQEDERRHLWNYLRRPPGEPREATWELIRLVWSSASALAVTPLQDLLDLGSAARMNVPGRADGQWGWRCPDDALNDATWQRLHELTRTSGRLAARGHP
jgi:4-alpha-glucanotransferase